MIRKKRITVVTFIITILLILLTLAALLSNRIQSTLDPLTYAQKTKTTNEPLQAIETNSSQKIKNASSSDLENDHSLLIIEHTPMETVPAFSPIKIHAKIPKDKGGSTVKLFYKKDLDKKFASVSMNKTTNDRRTVTAEIPAMDVESQIVYYFEISDGNNVKNSPEYVINVAKPNVDFSKVPIFLITEMVPDSTDISGLDGYEFVEIYNNTDKDMNFADYKLLYRTGAESTSDVIWPSEQENFVIRSNETLVFWMINDANVQKSVEDFNKHYKTNLVENENIVRVYNANIANSGMHGIVMADNTKKEISVAYYNDQVEKDDTKKNKGIIFDYPRDGSTNSIKVKTKAKKGTPGHIEKDQIPLEMVLLEEDRAKPTLKNKTTQIEIKETEDLNLSVGAWDDKVVRTVKVHYKTNSTVEYKNVILQKDSNTQLFYYNVPSPEIIGKDYLEYYFTVSDGTNETISDVFRVKITPNRNLDSLRSNVKEHQILSKSTVVKGTSREDSAENIKLMIDHKEVIKGTKTLENTAYLAFEVRNVNLFFQNAVTMGGEILHTFDDLIIDWQTISIPIQPDSIKIGKNTLSIRSGNKASPFELDSNENRDDFQLRNVRLVLGDGKIITDPSHTDQTKVMDMNDRNPVEDFHFILSEEDATSKSYTWDTNAFLDGQHTLIVKDSNETLSIPVVVDNNPPEILPTIEKGKQYKGEFVIDFVLSDVISGVDSYEVTMDGTKILTPYKTASSQLKPGKHAVHIKTNDKAGNTIELDIPFTVVDENPKKPEAVKSTKMVDATSTLMVKVMDPTKDEMEVAFYQALQYKPGKESSITAYQNTASVEPPPSPIPEGEQLVEKDKLGLISTEDGKYLTNDSFEEFPYHRFDVTLDSSVDKNDVVELVWKGKSLEGRKVTMYAWSHLENKWKAVTYKIAQKDDFMLKGIVSVSEYMNDKKINVMIQDEIPASANDYDYTFVWMSDTQYYAKLYPYIFDSQTRWIAQNKETMKIKYVFHTGDLVEETVKEDQWKNADNYMKTLEEANIPYGVFAGNHDVDHKTGDYTQFYRYFGEDRFRNKPYYGGTYKNNRGHYDLISVGGNDYLMMYLGWGIEEEGISWVNQVLTEHPDKKVILNFHEYLMASGTRHPNGETLYREIVLKNPNVLAVLSGHYHESQTLIDEIDDNKDGLPDRKVFQLLADYQSGPEGGQGYMRLLHIDQDNNRIIVNTYSPYLNDYNFFNPDVYPEKDEFVMNFDLQPMKKRVSTDYFEVNVYTDYEIGKVQNVKSGEVAEVKWNGVNNNAFSWYAVAKDNFSGKTVSKIWTIGK